MDRLDVLLRSSGHYSRKETRLLCDEGRITINGVPASSAAERCPAGALICVDGIPLQRQESVVLMMHKPAGYVCTAVSTRYPTVFSLLHPPESEARLFAVGRLDADTEGLLLLTNDGALSERITRPEREISKVYAVTFRHPLAPDAAKRMAEGITLPEGVSFRPARLTLTGEHSALVEVTEGRYHEVKRLIRAVGSHVDTLTRLSIGGLKLDPALRPGEYRPVTGDELRRIFLRGEEGRGNGLQSSVFSLQKQEEPTPQMQKPQ